MRYYRFVYVANKVFFEKLDLPYDDAATQVVSRTISEFDANDNVVKSGNDPDLEGNFTSYNAFDYDAANNLTVIHKADGTQINIAYSPIKDNFAQLAINTYGKKNLMVYQAESFAGPVPERLRQSPNLRVADTEELLIEAPVLPYYFRKTQTLNSAGSESTIVMTFYFK